MIVYKQWVAKSPGGQIRYLREGWYLFGFIPLLVRDVGNRSGGL